METKRKWLFWIIFSMVLLIFWALGVQAFYKIHNSWLSDSSLAQLKAKASNVWNFNPNTSQTVFSFNQLVRGFAYFVIFLALVTFSIYFFSWLDHFIAKEEKRIIDDALEVTTGKYGEYTGRRL